ncbi:AMP-binding enzyme family protein [Yersinia ruckeri]|uniref:AMP-dependent synthetase/ligase n=1 Tax=Yersinia ruckeri TaxID=29486 RepID=UPI0005AD064D|nr:AMP-dependent synthetase/ligase [Yersinia ruckeri]AJI95158.1 AMP-binding enzyme family protein [Yersinia ruckeri]MCW6569464.1 AMP-dependent synthetase/ligase [Yersinia ruckeri]
MILFERLAEMAAQAPLRPALCDSHRVIGYGELLPKIEALAERLRNEKISRLALFLDNSLDWALIDLAGALAHIVIIPVPVFFSYEQQNWLLDSSGADALIGPARAGWISTVSFEYNLQRRQPVSVPELPQHTAKITYTSGTTGHPKGVCLSWQHLMQVSLSLIERVAPANVQQHLTLLPLSTLLENMTGLYVPLLSGACSRIPSLAEVGFTGSSQFSYPILAQVIQQWRPHSLVLVPELLRLLVMLCAINPDLAASLRFVAVGGGKVAKDLVAKSHQLGLPVYEGYGLSECGSVVALNTLGSLLPGSVGKPLAHCQINIAQDGEILISGSTMLGYLGEPAPENAVATGDLGQFDHQGFLHITGRKKNVQITAFGRNFSPEWVEAEAQIFPAISRLVIFGDGLSANVALIQPTPGYENNLSDQIDQLNKRLPDYAQIHHYLLAQFSVENGLLTNNGRPKRQQILAEYHTRIHQLTAGEIV